MHIDNLNFQRCGDPDNPKKLVILHGLFGSGSNWRSIARELCATHEVFCLDLRNHGDSPWDDEMDYLSLALDVEHFMKERQMYHPSVIGHSMGGKTAMMIAQDLRVPLHRLIVADIAPVPYSHSHMDLVRALQALDLSVAKNRTHIDEMLSAGVSEVSTRQFLLQNIRREESGYGWRLNLEAIAANMGALLDYHNDHVSAVETLFLRGEHSDYVLPRHQAAIDARFPKSHVETIANAGHWLHAEKPRQVIDACARFLDR